MDDAALARARSLPEAKRRWLAARHARHESPRPIEDTDPFRRLARRLMRAFAALIAS